MIATLYNDGKIHTSNQENMRKYSNRTEKFPYILSVSLSIMRQRKGNTVMVSLKTRVRKNIWRKRT
ncbi:hypothetical protein D5282_17745 [bacterium 1xD8-48]|nr:hypothetical protein [bacterium 1xD8-48]